MPDKLQQSRVVCKGGLFTNEDTLTLAADFPGAAVRLVNYEVSQRGGYRRIDGFRRYNSEDFEVPGTGPIVGCFVFDDTVYAGRETTTGGDYEVFEFTTAVGWGSAVNVLTTGTPDTRSMSGVSRFRVTEHNFEGTEKITITDGVNYPATLTAGGTWEVLTSASSTGASDVEGAAVARSFSNHMAYAGMPGNRSNLVVFSAPNDHDNFTGGSGTASFNMGFTVLALAVFRKDLYVFGRDTIKKITGSSAANFAVEDVALNIGIVSSDAVLEVGGDVIYWSGDGIRLISGTDKIGDVNLETISENIKSTIINYPDTYDLNNVIGVVIRNKTQFRYFVYDGTQAATESVGIIGGKRYSPGGSSSQWEFGNLLGIRANCAHSGYIAGKEVVIHGGLSGYLYQSELRDTSFDGNKILSIYSTPYLDAGNTETLKDWESIHLFFRAEGPFGWAVGLGLGWDDPDYELPPNFNVSISTISSVYDDPDVKYDDTAVLYDGAGRNSRRINIPCTAPSMRFALVRESSVDRPHSIQGFVLRYKENDMRTN